MPKNQKYMSWEGQVFERDLIISIAEKFQIRSLMFDGDKVLVNSFRNYYSLPLMTDDRFFIRVKFGMDRPECYWEEGDLFYANGFRMDGKQILALYFYLTKPPCFYRPFETDSLFEEWSNAMDNVYYLAAPETKLKEKFDLFFCGTLPHGSHPLIKEITSEDVADMMDLDLDQDKH